MNINTIAIKAMKFRLKYFGKFCGPYYFTRILQKEGIHVGDNTVFYNPESQTIDRQRPWMLKIGDFCKITKGTVILTHDYSRSVLRRVYGEIIGEADETVIGDNVFIGMNSIILMGAHIGNNVIIGAGSVVSGTIPDNCVAAGNPCKVIRSLDEHYKKRKANYVDEAKFYARKFKEEYGRWPSIKEMDCFFPIYMARDRKSLEDSMVNTKLNGDNQEEIIEAFLASKPIYISYEDFIASC
ncbi:acyltransferase [Butyrivibrio fibrisolvens]|uniref:acyltransferase n=1 Tax=Butyrivibrio fibrisolvens TaxID=831 RepID=UPI000425CF5A|nr:acyltransferase [Butyrivibrio fibrisolvens]